MSKNFKTILKEIANIIIENFQCRNVKAELTEIALTNQTEEGPYSSAYLTLIYKIAGPIPECFV